MARFHWRNCAKTICRASPESDVTKIFSLQRGAQLVEQPGAALLAARGAVEHVEEDALLPAGQPRLRADIGRASWREREWQEVYIAGGDQEFKKTHINIDKYLY